MAFEADAFSAVLGSSSLYHVLVSAAVATCYRGAGEKRRLALHEAERATLFQELSKLLYLLRSHRAFPGTETETETGTGAVVAHEQSNRQDDLELQVTAMHVLLNPHLCPPPSPNYHTAATVTATTNEHLFACKVSSLQLLMVVAAPHPDPQRFHQALTALAARQQQRTLELSPASVACTLMRRVFYCTHPSSSSQAVGRGTESVLVPVLLVPFLRSLLGVLELLLLRVAGCSRGGLAAMGAQGSSGGAALIPILVKSRPSVSAAMPLDTHTHTLSVPSTGQRCM